MAIEPSPSPAAESAERLAELSAKFAKADREFFAADRGSRYIDLFREARRTAAVDLAEAVAPLFRAGRLVPATPTQSEDTLCLRKACVTFLGGITHDRACRSWVASEAAIDLLEHAVRATPTPPAPSRDEPTLAEECKPWEFHLGPPPPDDSPLSAVFGAGMAYTEKLLAGFLGVKSYEGGDGSENFDQDATKTLENILAEAGLYDPEDGKFAALASVPPAPSRDLVEAMREIERWLTYAAPCRSHDERMKMLGIVRAALATTQAPAEPSGGAEQVTCSHEPYLGKCAHCGVAFENGRPVLASGGAATDLARVEAENENGFVEALRSYAETFRRHGLHVEAYGTIAAAKRLIEVEDRLQAAEAALTEARATIATLQSQLAEKAQAERGAAEANANRYANIAVAWYDRAEALEKALEGSISAPGSATGGDAAGPSGWKLVPVEPTDEMFAAAAYRDRMYALTGGGHRATADEHWAAMIAAAPTPPDAAQERGR